MGQAGRTTVGSICSGRITLEHMAQDCFQMFLEYLQWGRDSTTSLGNVFQCSVTLTLKFFCRHLPGSTQQENFLLLWLLLFDFTSTLAWGKWQCASKQGTWMWTHRCMWDFGDMHVSMHWTKVCHWSWPQSEQKDLSHLTGTETWISVLFFGFS